jgi:hypothetical protein
MEPRNHTKVRKRRKKSLKRRIKGELRNVSGKKNYSLYITIALVVIIGIIIGKMVINYTLNAE